MNTILLQYALEVEKTGSITQAANNLYMEQPNLSKAIKTLEEMMGAPIFKRSSRGVVPTERGKVFLEHAREVLDCLEKMEGVYKKREEREPEIRLSVPRATYINEAFSRFVGGLDRAQGMAVWLRETNSADTVEEVADGTCQLGIIRYPVSLEKYYGQMIREKELSGKLIWEFSPILLMSGNHPLADRDRIPCADLAGYPEILHGDMKLPAGAGAAGAGSSPEHRIYVSERGSQINLLQTNPDTYMWVSALPERCLRQNSLIQRPCADAVELYRDVYIYRQDYQMTGYDKQFLEEIHRVKQELFLQGSGEGGI